MNEPVTRRRVLQAGAGATLAVVSAGPAAATGACDDYRGLAARLADERARLDDLQTEHDTLVEQLASAQATIDAARDRARGEHPYDAATREAAATVGQAARPGMVFLEMLDEHAVTTASAWYVDDHHLLTNRHNVEDVLPDTELFLWTVDGSRRSFEIVAQATDGPDVALLRTAEPAPTVLETGTSDGLAAGDRLVQIGNPGGFGKWVITLGELLERGAFGDLITTVPGLKGVSGSPILDMDGRVVGMTYGGRPRSEWEPGTRPMPSTAPVQTVPMVPNSHAMHVPIEQALELYEGWR